MPELDSPASPLGGRTLRRRGTLAAATFGLLAVGVAAGAGVVAEMRPSVSMAPIVPVAIRSLSATGIVTVRGKVTEVYGNKFIIADASGRALVDTGREGDERQLVTIGQPVTIQGRFEHGFVHAAFLIGPDRKIVSLGTLHGPGERHRHAGPRDPQDRPDGPQSPGDGAARPPAGGPAPTNR